MHLVLQEFPPQKANFASPKAWEGMSPFTWCFVLQFCLFFGLLSNICYADTQEITAVLPRERFPKAVDFFNASSCLPFLPSVIDFLCNRCRPLRPSCLVDGELELNQEGRVCPSICKHVWWSCKANYWYDMPASPARLWLQSEVSVRSRTVLNLTSELQAWVEKVPAVLSAAPFLRPFLLFAMEWQVCWTQSGSV